MIEVRIIIERLVVFIVMIILHEVGHIVMYLKYLKKFPRVRVTKFGSIHIGSSESSRILTIRQHARIATVGILLGCIPLIIYWDPYIALVYFLCSCYDITTIFLFFTFLESCKDVKMGKIKMVIE